MRREKGRQTRGHVTALPTPHVAHTPSLFPLDGSREHVSFLVLHGTPLFFQHFDGPYCPTLHLAHQCEESC